jgi:hypothetical protein
MSTVNVRPTNGSRTVVIASGRYHRQDINRGRECNHCGSLWTVDIDGNGSYQIWRNGVIENKSILDWTGGNVAIECCPAQDS